MICPIILEGIQDLNSFGENWYNQRVQQYFATNNFEDNVSAILFIPSVHVFRWFDTIIFIPRRNNKWRYRWLDTSNRPLCDRIVSTKIIQFTTDTNRFTIIGRNTREMYSDRTVVFRRNITWLACPWNKRIDLVFNRS